MPLFLAGTGTRGILSLVAFSATWDTWRPLKASAGVRREWGASAERGRRVAASCLARGETGGSWADAWPSLRQVGRDWGTASGCGRRVGIVVGRVDGAGAPRCDAWRLLECVAAGGWVAHLTTRGSWRRPSAGDTWQQESRLRIGLLGWHPLGFILGFMHWVLTFKNAIFSISLQQNQYFFLIFLIQKYTFNPTK